MYRPNNVRVVRSGTPLTFTVGATQQPIELILEFVRVERDGRHMKGVRITTKAPLPSNLQLLDEMGKPMTPGDGHVVSKGHNACAIAYDNEHCELFSVNLVDEGSDSAPLNTAGGVLYFHSTAAIPPELGGQGLLEPDPTSCLERICSSERFSS